MKFFSALITTALAVVGALAQNRMTVNTLDGVVACRPILITWEGGTSPYYLTVRLFAQPTIPPLVDFPAISGTNVTWLVNVPSGTSVFLNLVDSMGLVAQSGNFVIGSSTNTNSSCASQSLSYSAAAPTSATSRGSPSLSGATPTKSPNANSTSDALALSRFHIGAGAVVGALAFTLAA